MGNKIKISLILYFIILGQSTFGQDKKTKLLNAVDIEFTYELNGKSIRKTFVGLGEDPADGYFKPDTYDIVLKLNDGFKLEEYYLQVLIEEYIEPSNEYSLSGNKIQKGWVPINVVYSDLASRVKANKLIIRNPEYKLVYGYSSILYTCTKVRILVTSQHRKTKQIQYLIKDYEIPM